MAAHPQHAMNRLDEIMRRHPMNEAKPWSVLSAVERLVMWRRHRLPVRFWLRVADLALWLHGYAGRKIRMESKPERSGPRYRCRLCGRDRFDRPGQSHKCRGGYRKGFPPDAFVELSASSSE